jgi:hypothetical protein
MALSSPERIPQTSEASLNAAFNSAPDKQLSHPFKSTVSSSSRIPALSEWPTIGYTK